VSSASVGRQRLPNLATRTVIMFAAVAVICVLALGVVNLATHPTTDRAVAEVRSESGAEGERNREPERERSREPEFVTGLEELAVQVLLVAGIGFAGRTILKIRL
jgi:hypothetical protein